MVRKSLVSVLAQSKQEAKNTILTYKSLCH